ncbi:glutamate--tRNA ligase family protein, partial [Sutterella wadsworthensis]
PKAAEFAAACFAAREKLGQSAVEQNAASILNGWTNGVPDVSDPSVKALFELLTDHPEHFTPLLQSALSAVIRPNFFLLSHQYEFNRLSLTYVVVSKRKLIQLVKEKYVDGWDDPRMPTIIGLRRRGYTPQSMQMFAERCGISKVSGGWIDYSVLEQCLREDLEGCAHRRMAVMKPLKLIIDNYPEGQSEELVAENHPQKPEMGSRSITFSRELWIEETDFAEVPPKGFRRLTVPADGSPAKPVRLRYGYVIVPTSFEKDAAGRVTVVHANYFPETKSGTEGSMSVKTKATIHWLDAQTARAAEFRVYDRLFNEPNPEAGEGSFLDHLTPNSKTILQGYVEPCTADAANEERFQFERTGYFVADRKDHAPEHPVFNLSVGLRDSWGK